jgi:MFS superfamily sulfate permease-like transporter
MLGEYQREWLRPDVLAGLTTAAVISTATTIAVLTGSALGLTLPAAPAWLDTQAGALPTSTASGWCCSPAGRSAASPWAWW